MLHKVLNEYGDVLATRLVDDIIDSCLAGWKSKTCKRVGKKGPVSTTIVNICTVYKVYRLYISAIDLTDGCEMMTWDVVVYEKTMYVGDDEELINC